MQASDEGRSAMGVMLFPWAFALAAASAAPAAEPVGPALPDWMAGCWIEQDGERSTEECWMAPRGGIMLGASRAGTGERVTEAELMRIETAVMTGLGRVAGMTFSAIQRTGGWTTFVRQPEPDRAPDQAIAFVNAAHDYPQKIRYWRDGERLLAEISQIDGSKARRWTYVQARN
jgi:hypothetical protein